MEQQNPHGPTLQQLDYASPPKRHASLVLPIIVCLIGWSCLTIGIYLLCIGLLVVVETKDGILLALFLGFFAFLIAIAGRFISKAGMFYWRKVSPTTAYLVWPVFLMLMGVVAGCVGIAATGMAAFTLIHFSDGFLRSINAIVIGVGALMVSFFLLKVGRHRWRERRRLKFYESY